MGFVFSLLFVCLFVCVFVCLVCFFCVCYPIRFVLEIVKLKVQYLQWLAIFPSLWLQSSFILYFGKCLSGSWILGRSKCLPRPRSPFRCSTEGSMARIAPQMRIPSKFLCQRFQCHLTTLGSPCFVHHWKVLGFPFMNTKAMVCPTRIFF